MCNPLLTAIVNVRAGLVATFLAASISAATAATELLVMGGVDGLPWRDGGGQVAATVIVSDQAIEHTNTPGGVVDFEREGKETWIFPSEADTSENILIGFTSASRGGSVKTPIPSFEILEPDFRNMHDGDANTALVVAAERFGASGAKGLILNFDLGSVFAVNRIRFSPRAAFRRDFTKGYQLVLNDGSPEAVRANSLIWDEVAEEGQNEEVDVDIRFDTRFVRHIRFRSTARPTFEIAEFEVFSEGFAPQALYLSDIFDFGEPAILGNLRWVREKIGDEARSRALIRTRTGIDPEPVEYTRIGVQSSGRQLRSGALITDVPIDALWKKAEDVEDADLKSVVETLLDHESRDGREVLLDFTSLPLEDRLRLALDEDDYFDLDADERSVIRDDLTNWSSWSAPYPLDGVVDEGRLADPLAGTPVASPTPRRYFQFMIQFFNDSFNAATGTGALAVDVTKPAFAQSLIAEIFPRQAEVGRETEFTYAVLYRSDGRDSGFDRFEVRTPVRTESVGRVEISEPDGNVTFADFTGQSLANPPVTQGQFGIEESRQDGFVISFPQVQRDSTLLKIDFSSAVLRVGTRFSGGARNSADRLFAHPVIAGNATDLSRGQLVDPDDVVTGPVGTLKEKNLFVDVQVVDQLLVNVGTDIGVFTPNQDGINDTVTIQYDVTNVAPALAVEVRIFDLSGRLVSSQTQGRRSGRYRHTWDGRNQVGELVPPGNYVYAVSMNVPGSADAQSAGVVGVAY
ncbi:MAG: gliding motility-associated C-terminal domain-containing protein [Gemmatimonadetes bacterium]|nr:gliding motility-associated C-terminal domain-containing protein [Gemmatimonadota bacterium]